MKTSEAMAYLGIQKNGKLAPCPEGPLGVGSSYPDDKKHFRSPFPFEGDEDSAKRRLIAILQSMSGVELVEENGPYLHFERESPLLRWVSDIEFLVDETRQVIDYRASLRFGFWDFGAHARLIDKVESIFRRLPT